jgi:Tfp pilus assembly protein PilO
VKELANKFLSNLHYILILYGLYAGWTMYEEHSTRMEALRNQASGIDAQIAVNTKKVAEVQDFIKKTDEYKARVEAVAKNIESAQKQLPADINDTQILEVFNKEVKEVNIKEPTTTPGKEESSTYFISKDYTLKAKGTYLQFLVFLERIGNATRIYNIKSLKLVQSNENKKSRFQVINGEMVIQAFRFNPNFKVDRGFDQINKQFPVK